MTKSRSGKKVIHEYNVYDAKTGKQLYHLATESKMTVRKALISKRKG